MDTDLNPYFILFESNDQLLSDNLALISRWIDLPKRICGE